MDLVPRSQTQISNTSSEHSYSLVPLSPASLQPKNRSFEGPPEGPEKPHKACSDEEEDDEEDFIIEFQEMGEAWVSVVNALVSVNQEQAEGATQEDARRWVA